MRAEIVHCLKWLGGSVLRFLGVFLGLFYLLVFVGFVSDRNALGSILAIPFAAAFWTAWIGTILFFLMLPSAVAYLVLLLALPLRRGARRVQRAVIVALGPLATTTLWLTLPESRGWDSVPEALVVGICYGAIVRLPPTWRPRVTASLPPAWAVGGEHESRPAA